jgi:hypothetical protein
MQDPPDPPRARAFVVAFAVLVPAIYTLCEMQNWPLFTYHPGTGRLDWGYAPAVRDEGPAMYWYGWVTNSLGGGALLAGLAAAMAGPGGTRWPLWPAWVAPLVAIPLLIYALRYYWRF